MSILLCLYIARVVLRLRRKVHDDPVGRAGLSTFIISTVSFIFYFIFILVDAALGAGYTVFIYIAWVCTTGYAIAAFLGLMMPGWLKKWILARSGQSDG